MQAPSQNEATVDVNYRGQIHESLLHGNVCDGVNRLRVSLSPIAWIPAWQTIVLAKAEAKFTLTMLSDAD